MYAVTATSSACASSSGIVSTSCSCPPINTFVPRLVPPSGLPPPPPPAPPAEPMKEEEERATYMRSTLGGRVVGSLSGWGLRPKPSPCSPACWSKPSPSPSASWKTSWIFEAAGENTLDEDEEGARGWRVEVEGSKGW